MSVEYVMLYSSFPDAETAKNVAHSLVADRLVACANIFPGVQSIYWWQGNVVDDAEVVLIAKTTKAGSQAALAALVERHPYSVPCAVLYAMEDGHMPYLKWLGDSIPK